MNQVQLLGSYTVPTGHHRLGMITGYENITLNTFKGIIRAFKLKEIDHFYY